jgi:hypothetical protein
MQPLYSFEITIHARPDAASAGGDYVDEWGTWPTLAIAHEALAEPMAIGFDEAFERLAGIERMYAEPDGSFVWACPQVPTAPHQPRWQVDGNAFERSGRVVLVDLKGTCPVDEFDRLLAAFGWPGQPLVMELVRPAVLLDEPTFRRHAAARAGGQAGRPPRSA